jgi:hypothetical protein
LQETASRPSTIKVMRTRSSDLREQRIARQIEVVLAQEEALDQRRNDLRRREDRIIEREEDQARRQRDQELAWSKKKAELEERERAVTARERALDQRSKALDEAARKKAKSLADEAVELTERNREVAWREKAVKAVFPDPAVDDTQEIKLEAVPPAGGWNLNRIERLVEANAGANPDRVPEWRYYLLYLREFAEIGGALPSSFDRLVWDAFGDLLAADAIAAA